MTQFVSRYDVKESDILIPFEKYEKYISKLDRYFDENLGIKLIKHMYAHQLELMNLPNRSQEGSYKEKLNHFLSKSTFEFKINLLSKRKIIKEPACDDPDCYEVSCQKVTQQFSCTLSVTGFKAFPGTTVQTDNTRQGARERCLKEVYLVFLKATQPLMLYTEIMSPLFDHIRGASTIVYNYLDLPWKDVPKLPKFQLLPNPQVSTKLDQDHGLSIETALGNLHISGEEESKRSSSGEENESLSAN